MTARHVAKGHPVHDAEARGIQALVKALPDNYWVFSNIELASDRRGQTFEHDAVVLAPHALFTVELKSWGGRVVGNRDRWTLADGTVVQSPIPLILAKARVLKGRLQSRRRELGNVWVQGIVLLSAADASPDITADFKDYVVNLEGVKAALTSPGWLGHPTPITPGQRRAIEDYLNDGRPARLPDQLEDYRLVQRLAAEDRPFEAWLAERTSLTRERRVLHTYTIVGETEAERERLRAHALREATLHSKLRGGADILRYDTYLVTKEDPQRIVLQFEDTTPLQPMDVWAKDRKPGTHARLKVAARVARALAWVHEKGLVHRRLSPEAVLVSSEDVPLEVRLCAFELARDLTGAAPTVTGSSLGDPTFRCAAPEVLKTGEATPRSDLFSLGATLVELFTGRSLFATVDEVLRQFAVPALLIGDRPCPRPVSELVRELLAVDPAARPENAAVVAERLERTLHELTHEPVRTELAPGTEVRQTYELIARLGRGATATTWKARQLQTDQIVVLKIAESEHAHYLQEEGRVLGAVHHPNLVRFHNVEPFEGGNLLVLEYVEGFTAALWAAAGDPLDPPRFLGAAKGLLGALGALHQAGWVHRDVKPDNVMLTEAEAIPKLLDVGLAAKWPVEGDLAVGTIRYKDPLVYVDNRWTPANDLFAVFLVLYELLTGTHPFGGGSPEPAQRPTIQREEFPESFSERSIDKLAKLFARALSPDASERPNSTVAALAELELALAEDEPAAQVPAGATAPHPSTQPPLLVERSPLAASVTLTTPVADLGLSTRAQGALARLGLATVADLVGFDPEAARGLPNVGSKSIRELRALCVEIAARWPAEPKHDKRPIERFYPALAEDPRSLDELGKELTPGMKDVLVARGIFSIGDLAAMPPAALERLPSIGPGKLGRVRSALRRLAGREEVPESLTELNARLAEELGERAWDVFTRVLGLNDCKARVPSEVAHALGLSRQRVSQLTDLDPLRAEASWAHYLTTLLTEAMPPVGFSTLDAAGQSLATRLPSDGKTTCALGFARLVALLLSPDARAADAVSVRWLVRPPWTSEAIQALLSRLGSIGNWPPVPRAQAESQLWDATPSEIQRALVRWGADAGQLLDGLLRLDETVQLDRVGGLYTPPVQLCSALRVLRPGLSSPVIDTETLMAEVHAAYRGVLAADSDEIELAIEQAGYRRDGDRWVDPGRIDAPGVLGSPKVDASIPTQRVSAGHLPPVIEGLAAQIDRGGFRVVALSPTQHHRLARQLAAWFGESVGAERVHFVAVDRLLIEAMKTADLWKFVPFLEVRAEADWRMFHAELTAALDDAVKGAKAGTITVLGQPSLLGTLGLMSWLSGFYERARGGKHGLVVLAVPGGIHEDRVRLNEKYNLPYTPDMAAVYLESADVLHPVHEPYAKSQAQPR